MTDRPNRGYVLHRVFAEERLSAAGLLTIERALPVMEAKFTPGSYSPEWASERTLANFLLPAPRASYTLDWTGQRWDRVDVPIDVADRIVWAWAECVAVRQRWAGLAMRSIAWVASEPQRTHWTETWMRGEPISPPTLGSPEWRDARRVSVTEVLRDLGAYATHRESLLERASLLAAISTRIDPWNEFVPLTGAEISAIRSDLGWR